MVWVDPPPPRPVKSLTLQETSAPSKMITRIAEDDGIIMAQLSIGDPVKSINLNFDMSISPLTWTNCPFTYDPPKNSPDYIWEISKTYKEIPPSSPLCEPKFTLPQCEPKFSPQCEPKFFIDGEKCYYYLTYPNYQGVVNGELSYERFTFEESKNKTMDVNTMIFGCNREEASFFDSGSSDGILSMTRSPKSLISQLKNVTGSHFSYCLVLRKNVKSYLTFGDEIPDAKGKVQVTPLVQHIQYPYAYAMDLIDVSVGDIRMKIPSRQFIVDSGATLTRLDQELYTSIQKVLESRFAKYGLKKASASKFELCYEMGVGLKVDVVLVPVTLHFRDGADLKIPLEKVFILKNANTSFCLGLLPSDGPNILGAIQQQDVRFVFDLEKGKISFSEEVSCTGDSK